MTTIRAVSVRLWVPWTPEPYSQVVPAGQFVEMTPAEARQVCEAGGGEIVEAGLEMAVAAAPRERAVKRKRKRR